MKTLGRIVLTCAIAAFLAMCDSTEPEENRPLSEEETVGLLNGMVAVLADTMPEFVAVHGPEDVTIACPEGGDARYKFRVSDQASGDTARTAIGINFAPAACEIEGSEGTDFILDANPGVDYDLIISIVGFFDYFDVSGGLSGQLDWKVEERFGTCSMDMNMEAELDLLANPPTSKTFLTGDACDHALKLDVTEDVAVGPTGSPRPRTRNTY